MIRDYENTPRPEIEQHHHIRDLIEKQDKVAKDRGYHRDREKLYADRMDTIKSEPAKETKAFWCEACRTDFASESIKEVEIDWTNTHQYIAFYRSKCPQGHWCMRFITDKWRDPYFFRSRKVALDTGLHAADIIQPHETNYQLLYGRKNKS